MAELQLAGRYEWERIIRRCRFPGRPAAARDLKLVALAFSTFADPDGTHVRPGVPRLAAVCLMGESTVRRYVDALLELGLLERVSNGGGRGRNGQPTAARYRLTIPDDLLERVELLGPDERTPLALGERSSVDADPVDNPNSAHCGERSSDDARPVDNPELRSLMSERSATTADDGTPLTSGGNSAHFGGELRSPMGERLPPNLYQPPDQPPSPEPGTSPEPVDNEPRCRSCKWLPRYGHAPGCTAAVPA